MRVFSLGKHCTIGSVAPGSLISVEIGDVVTFCIVLTTSAQKMEESTVIALWPGHPMLLGKAGLLSAHAFNGASVLAYSEAIIAPSPKPEHLRLGRLGWRAPVGALIQFGDNFAITALTDGRNAAAFNCDNGLLLNGFPQYYAYFTSWEVMVQTPSGDLHTLFEMTLPPT